MRIYHRPSFLLPVLSLFALLLFAACGNSTSPSATSGTTLKKVSIGLGYIPDIQFAPFYVAQSKGYYKAAGLDVTFHHGIVPDLIGSMVLGHDTFVFAGGDEALVARSKNLQVVDVATIFQRYPVSLIVPANSSIQTLTDLKVQSIGFTQVAALIARRVDAVMGYSNNEPLQLKSQGFNVRTFDVSNYQPLVSNGIITTAGTLHSQPQLVRSFVQATIKGLKDVIADPAGAVQISKGYVPNFNPTRAIVVLQATIPIWQGNGQIALGFNDSATWQSMEQFLLAQKIIPSAQDITQAYTNQSVS